MARLYVVSNVSSPFAAGSALHTVLELTATSTSQVTVVGFDVAFDGITASNVPVKVDFCRVANTATGAASPPVPSPLLGGGTAATTTVKWNATSEGASAPAAICGWYVPPTSGFSYQFPLGREIVIAASGLLALRTTPANAVNVIANIWIEE